MKQTVLTNQNELIYKIMKYLKNASYSKKVFKMVSKNV